MHRLGNPLSVACPNKSCAARVGAPCTTPGGHLNAHPHMPRLRAVSSSSDEDLKAAAETYRRGILEQLLGREPTQEELGRAARDGSLHIDKGWLRDAIDDRAPRRRRPSKRVDANGTVTLWGAVTVERPLDSGSYILQLDSGEVVRLRHTDGWPWGEWWPERKAEVERFGIRKPRFRFTIAKNGQTISVDFEEDHIAGERDLSVVKPSKGSRDQIGLEL